MTPVNEYIPQTISHPGAILEEKLQEMKMSIKEFALRTGKPEQTIIAVIKGNSAITQGMAIKFENVTKIPAAFWMRHQQCYDEFKTREKLKVAVSEAETWTKSFPYSEMAKNYGLPKTRKIEEKTQNLFEFFAVSSHTAWEKLYMKSELKIAAYTSLKYTHEPHAISAWLRQGELQAEQIEAPEYNKKEFQKVLSDIKDIMAKHPDDFFTQLQQRCLKAGVKVFYTPKMSKAPISGSTRWIKGTPVIQLTARYRQNDRFWFTFFHEAGHILLHGKKYISLEDVDFSAADPKKEQEAHDFAEEWTFSKKQEQEIINAAPLTENGIVAFAEKFNTHPAMIIGCLQHRDLIPFSVGRQFIVPVDLSNN
jgi:addiction module HigA family antidote